MKRALERVQGFLQKGGASLGSLVKVAVMSRATGKPGTVSPSRDLIILGNGPSLRSTIDNRREWLGESDLMAVNFAANTPDWHELRPAHYVLADGHFFDGISTDPNVSKLWKNIGEASWSMTLWVSAPYAAKAKELVHKNANVNVKTFNLTPLEGWHWLTYRLMDRGLGMPRPRNVMVPSLMTGIRLGYKRIYLCGADHTWTKTLGVDDENFVVSVQPHFYEDNDREHARVRQAYAGLRLHDVLGSMATAFRSYWEVRDYAKSKGVEIVNSTPGSMIDAFPRERSGQ